MNSCWIPELGAAADGLRSETMRLKACWVALALAFVAGPAEAQVIRGAVCMTMVT